MIYLHHGTRVAVPVALCCWASLAVAADKDYDLLRIASNIENNNRAWQDLQIEYSCDVFVRGEGGQFEQTSTCHLDWSGRRNGWEKLVRKCSPADKHEEDSGLIDAASYDGELYYTWSSQGEQSGGFGHQREVFLTSPLSHKPYMYVGGLDVGLPMTVDDYLRSKAPALQVTGGAPLLSVRGQNPYINGAELIIELSREYDYMPVSLETRLKDKKLVRCDIEKYRRVLDAPVPFWFPEEATWWGAETEPGLPGSKTHYRLSSIKVNQGLQRKDFVFPYPRGALVLNTDTGEGGYLKQDATRDDVPDLGNKRITYAEHDALLNGPAPASTQPPSNVLLEALLIGNGILLALFLTGLAVRYAKRRKRRAAPS